MKLRTLGRACSLIRSVLVFSTHEDFSRPLRTNSQNRSGGVMKRPVKGGAEQDALTSVRRHFIWRPGARKRIKTQANRRERRAARQALP